MILLIFPAVITIHNLEEALWLPAWSENARKFHRPVTPGVFHFAVTVITLLAYAATALYLICPESIVCRFLFIGFMGSMVINTVFPHLAATIATKSYCPGTLTGVLAVSPACLYLLHRLVMEGKTGIPFLMTATAATGAILLALLPLLFRTGEAFSRRISKPAPPESGKEQL